jgi:hypothetical protein
VRDSFVLRSLHVLAPDVRPKPCSARKLADTGGRESFVPDDDVAVQPAGLVKLDGAHVLGAPPGAATAKTLHDERKIPPEMLQMHVVGKPQPESHEGQAGIGENVESQTDAGLSVSLVAPSARDRRAPDGSAWIRRMQLAGREVDVAGSHPSDALGM